MRRDKRRAACQLGQDWPPPPPEVAAPRVGGALAGSGRGAANYANYPQLLSPTLMTRSPSPKLRFCWLARKQDGARQQAAPILRPPVLLAV